MTLSICDLLETTSFSSFLEYVIDEELAEGEWFYVYYVSRIELDADEEADLSRKLEILHNLTWNGRIAKANHVVVSVKYFVPCQDENNFAFGNAGQYETATGIVLKVDTEVWKEITIQTETIKKVIALDDILEITSKSDVFQTDWELDAP